MDLSGFILLWLYVNGSQGAGRAKEPRRQQAVASYGGVDQPCIVPQLSLTGGAVASVPCTAMNTLCMGGVCRCASTYRSNGTVCVQLDQAITSTLDWPCASSSDCMGTAERCSLHTATCTCLDTHVHVNGQCLPVVHPGRTGCTDARQCSRAFPGSYCSPPPDRLCVCPDGLAAIGGTCAAYAAGVVGEHIAAGTGALRQRAAPAESNGEASDNNDVRSLKMRDDTAPVLFDYLSPRREPDTATSASKQGVTLPSESVPPGGACSSDQHCAGYPYAYCGGTCMCKQAAINAGSTCVAPGSVDTGNCQAGQVYVSEAGLCMNIARPGAPCQYSQQCSGSEVGAFCIAQRCRCVYGMLTTAKGECTFVNANCTERGTVWIGELGQCKPVVAPGAVGCSHRQQCTESFKDSTCFLQQCACPQATPQAVDGTCGEECTSGQSFSGVLGRCISTVQPGHRCIYTSQCHALYPGMICERATCRCPNGRKWTGSQCSDACPQGFIINPDTAVCRPGCLASEIEYNGECLKRAAPDSACRITAQCLGGSSCANGVCKCPKGTQVQTGAVCRQLQSAPGQSCGNGEQCTGNSRCASAVCQCIEPNAVVLNAQCITPVTVGANERCSETTVCVEHAGCVHGICLCQRGTVVVDRRCRLMQRVWPGDACTAQEHMCMGDSTCTGGRCRCPKELVLDDDRRCVQRQQAHVGESCSRGETCTGNSVCDTGRKVCVCPDAHYADAHGQCRMIHAVSPGDGCDGGRTRKCTGGSYCDSSSRTCTCPKGYSPTDDACTRSQAAPGQSCANSEQCTGNSLCDKETLICVCHQSQHHPVDGVCVARADALPGDSCANGEHCTAGSSCDRRTRYCLCPQGHRIANAQCIEQRTACVGAPCDERYTLCQHGSVCRDEVCQCVQGHVLIDGRCVNPPAVAPGASCSRGELCSGQSYCTNGVCTCPVGLVPRSDVCVLRPKAQPGSSCGQHEECVAGSTCHLTTRICTCPADHIVMHGTCVAVETVRPGQRCAPPSAVCGGGSQCDNAVCVCPQSAPTVSADGTVCTAHRHRPPAQQPHNNQLVSRAAVCPLPANPSACSLPSCFCSRTGKEIPGGLPPNDTPQMVILTFDDAITDAAMPLYDQSSSIFDGSLVNRNGCPIKATFFVSHEFTNYDAVEWLAFNQHEIAVNSITHSALAASPVARWQREMEGMRDALRTFAGVGRNAVRGVRAPNLAIGGDSQFDVITTNHFLYDNSMSVNPGMNGTPYWPQTLDYAVSWRCDIEPCPKRPYNGIWALPINQFYGYYLPEIGQHMRAAMLRGALRHTDTAETAYKVLMRNFDRAYDSNRAPVVVTLSADFLRFIDGGGGVQALRRFINHTLSKPDVWYVTGSQAVDWMRSPTAASRLRRFDAWNCAHNVAAHRPCTRGNANVCGYRVALEGGERYFRSCKPCPPAYPWLNDPTGGA